VAVKALARLRITCKSQNVPRVLKLPRSWVPPWIAVPRKGTTALLRVTRGHLSLQANRHPLPYTLTPHPTGYRGKRVPNCKVPARILRCSRRLLGSLAPIRFEGMPEIYHYSTKVSLQFTTKKRKRVREGRRRIDPDTDFTQHSTSLTPLHTKPSGPLYFEYLQPQSC